MCSAITFRVLPPTKMSRSSACADKLSIPLTSPHMLSSCFNKYYIIIFHINGPLRDYCGRILTTFLKTIGTPLREIVGPNFDFQAIYLPQRGKYSVPIKMVKCTFKVDKYSSDIFFVAMPHTCVHMCTGIFGTETQAKAELPTKQTKNTRHLKPFYR